MEWSSVAVILSLKTFPASSPADFCFTHSEHQAYCSKPILWQASGPELELFPLQDTFPSLVNSGVSSQREVRPQNQNQQNSTRARTCVRFSLAW